MSRPSRPLSPNVIRDAALALIDAEGLAALSMRRLAAELGVKAASLYSHVPGKDAVLDAIANMLASRVDTSGFAEGWRAGLLGWGRSYHAVLREHPKAAPIVAAGAGRRSEYLAMADAVHGGLVGDGWPPRHATMAAASVKYLVIGAAITPFGSGFADDTAVYIGRYPNLSMAHRLREVAEEIDADSFELALNSLLDGLELVYKQVARGGPKTGERTSG